MVNKKGQEIFQIEGTVVRKFPTEYGKTNAGKQWSKNKFLVKTLDGRDLFVSTFGNLEASWIGKDVRFGATKYNETNYTLDGELHDAGNLVGSIPEPVQAVTTTPVSTKRRGRPSKTTENTVQVSPSVQVEGLPIPTTTGIGSVDGGLESVRDEAEAIVNRDLFFARTQLGEKASAEAQATLVQALQAVRATLFIEANKRHRVADFKTSKRY